MNILKVFRGISQYNCTVHLQQIRRISSKTVIFLEDLGDVTTKYEVTNVPEEWRYVERILPPTLIPEPPVKSTYPSGWKPQEKDAVDKPYFVERTKNHMLPVYMVVLQRGIRRLTYIKKIKGDIWLLEKEIRAFLQKGTIIPIRLQVHEFAGYICINGDHVNAIKHFLTKKGL